MDRSPNPARSRALRLLGPVLVLLAVGLLAVAPIPAFVVAPGTAFSLAEEMRVDDLPASPRLRGDYLFTTIALTDARTVDLLRSAVDPDRRVAARSAFVPAGVDDVAFITAQREAFADAAATAAAVAGALLARPDLDVVVLNDVVGGPSAGLLVALAAYDVASPVDLAAGRRIAGTGEVQPDGRIVDVGSVDLKVASAVAGGADVFVLPADQAEAARAALPAGASMQVLAADTVADAVAALAAEG